MTPKEEHNNPDDILDKNITVSNVEDKKDKSSVENSASVEGVLSFKNSKKRTMVICALILIGLVSVVLIAISISGLEKSSVDVQTQDVVMPAPTRNSNEQRISVTGPNNPNVSVSELETTDTGTVQTVNTGVELVLVSGIVRPSEYTDLRILDYAEYTGQEQGSRWVHISETVDAGTLQSLDVETVCSLDGSSTGCPYLYLQTSSDLEKWFLLAVSTESPPNVGKTAYSYDLSTMQTGRYFRYVLLSQECEGSVCRQGDDWYGDYSYSLSAVFSE